ncbi:sulfotransferase [Jatrophihabitans sp.]|uniref:sulfotransferase family protein n=1 Tax=Jatrophihabitans sp. TaxID=1932789 RepID=UPI0030C6F7EE|nr:Sulfotransferase domain [Jatrophihabitans sp.]
MSERIGLGTVEDVHASAQKITGLSDFGSPDYLEALEVLMDSYARDERLTPFGNKAKRAEIRSALVARLFTEQAFKDYPDSAEVQITRPIFVTGLPRTGTTALHRLLCADPAHQGLELWLAVMPQPRPPRDTWADNPIYAHMSSMFEKFHADNPDFSGIHYMTADTVEECWQLLRQELMSISYESLAYLPTYSEWLQTKDWAGAYDRHRRTLQLIGMNDAERRWILKNPSHLFALDALLATYPDAIVIQTHRDPRQLIASTSSLSAQATLGQSELFLGEVIGRSQLELWARGGEAFAEARTRHDPSHFLDIEFAEFNVDPVGVALRVYEHFDIPLSEAAVAAIHAEGDDSRSEARRPTHKYSLADFGLTEADVEARFGL